MKKVLAALIVTMMMFGFVFMNKGAVEALATPEETIPQETVVNAEELKEVIQNVYTNCDSFYGRFTIVRNDVIPHENGDITSDLIVYNHDLNEEYKAKCVLTPEDFSETYLSLLIVQSQVCEGA